MKLKATMAGAALAMLSVLALPVVLVSAHNNNGNNNSNNNQNKTIVVQPSDLEGWSSVAPLADTRTNGQVNFISDLTSPLPKGALQLKTGDTTPSPGQDKAQMMHAANVALSTVNKLSYKTKQNSASFVAGLPSFQLPTCLYGVASGACKPSPNPGGQAFATLVYEPYVDQGNAAVQNGVWQTWNVAAGKFWSTRNEGILQASQGTYTYTLAQIKAAFPNAVLQSYGVNVGSNNPNWDTEVDAVVFNNITWDFETDPTYPQTYADCYGTNWKTFTGVDFKSKEKCKKYVRDHATRVRGNVEYNAYGLNRAAQFGLDTGWNDGWFRYSDDNDDWYRADISAVKVEGKKVWFAGKVVSASNPAWVGNWVFVKADTKSHDKFWGSFTDETTATNGVKNMTNPADGPFSLYGDVKFY